MFAYTTRASRLNRRVRNVRALGDTPIPAIDMRYDEKDKEITELFATRWRVTKKQAAAIDCCRLYGFRNYQATPSLYGG